MACLLKAGKVSKPNKRINTRFARGGQIHVGSPRFARYFSLRIFARYAGRYISFKQQGRKFWFGIEKIK